MPYRPWTEKREYGGTFWCNSCHFENSFHYFLPILFKYFYIVNKLISKCYMNSFSWKQSYSKATSIICSKTYSFIILHLIYPDIWSNICLFFRIYYKRFVKLKGKKYVITHRNLLKIPCNITYLYIIIYSLCQYDLNQHDDGNNKLGIWRHQE